MLRNHRLLFWNCSCFVFLALAALPCAAQVSSGSLLGDVRDEKAAPVSGVSIVVQSNGTGFSRSAATNAFGSYRIDDLLPGAYTVTAEHNGFQTVTVSPVFVEVNQKARLDIDLKVGSAHDSITVTARTSPVQTDDAGEGYQLGSSFIEALPLLGRNIISLVTLGPGAIPRQLGGFTHDIMNDLQGNRGAVAFNAPVNGARSNQNSYILDGAYNTDGNVFAIAVVPPMETVSEFRIQSSLAPAEFAQSAGGVVDVVTKSGSKAFHGNAFDFLRNEFTRCAQFLRCSRPAARRLPAGSIRRHIERPHGAINLLFRFVRRLPVSLGRLDPAPGSGRGGARRRLLGWISDFQSTVIGRERKPCAVSQQRDPAQHARSRRP